MALLFVLIITNSITWFALSILLLRNIWSLGANVTTIESWEIARHETLIRRARVSGGYLDGPDGIKVRITRQEFPYDIGIFRNICQGMGNGVFLWLWPFAATPSNESGLQFPTNGFEGSNKAHVHRFIAHFCRPRIGMASSRSGPYPEANETAGRESKFDVRT